MPDNSGNKDELDLDFSAVTDFFKKRKNNDRPKGAEIHAESNHEPKPHHVESNASNEDEFNFDFKKIKSWFSKSGNNENKDEDMSINWRKGWNIIKNNPAITVFILLLILQFLPANMFFCPSACPWGGINARMSAQNLPAVDNWAQSTVDNYYKNQIQQQVSQEYPHLPDDKKTSLIDEQFAKFKTEHKDEYSQQVTAAGNEIKSQWQYKANGNSYTYMPDIDSYFWLRYARNLAETSHFYDEINPENNEPWDNHMLAPLGMRAQDNNKHPYVLALIYEVMHFFNGSITLMQAAGYFPIIAMLLAFFAAFMAGKRLSGILGGAFAAAILMLLPVITGKTLFGHTDTDAYNILFPMFITWFFIEAIYAKSIKKQIIWAVATAVTIPIFGLFWPGWWYLMYFVLGASAVYGVWRLKESGALTSFEKIKEIDFKKITTWFIIPSIIIITCLGFATIIINPTAAISAIKSPFEFMSIKIASHPSLWPNVYTTVAELNPGSVSAAIDSVGGSLLFWLGIGGIFLIALHNKRKQYKSTAIFIAGWIIAYFAGTIVGNIMKLDGGSVWILRMILIGIFGAYLIWNQKNEHASNVAAAAMLAVWFLATAYATTKGIRFALLLAPGFALTFGAFMGIGYERLKEWLEESMNIKAWMTLCLVILFGVVLLTYPSNLAASTISQAGNDIPMVNDAWYNALLAINETSQPNAIITSWWDFGHQFKYIADRPVTFDGASQDRPIAHWVGKLLLTDNEDEAVGILRMLACGSQTGLESLGAKYENDTPKSVEIINKIILMSKDDAASYLKTQGLTGEQALNVTSRTHCDPPEEYVIASDDMIGKAGVWSHFGSWSFMKADIWQNYKDIPQSSAVPELVQKYGLSEEEAKNLFEGAKSITDDTEANKWIAAWPSYLSGLSGCNEQDSQIVCSNGVIINGDSVTIKTQQGDITPLRYAYIDENNEFRVKTFEGGQDIGVVLIPQPDGGLGSIIANAPLESSMFTRLFFMDGHGLKHFTKITTQKQITGGMIYVWKVDWEGHESNSMEQLKTHLVVENNAKTEVNYIGWTDDNSVFDSSIHDWQSNNITKDSEFDDYNTSPLNVQIGQGQLLPAFEREISGMKAGDEKIIKIPANEAYNQPGHPLYNQDLNFKVNIVSVQ